MDRHELNYRKKGNFDFIVPFDLENDITPANAEVQFGKMFAPPFRAFVDDLFGIGNDKPYEWASGWIQLLIINKIFFHAKRTFSFNC